MSYAKITEEHPAYYRVRALLDGGAFACDSVDHNEPYEKGCSNPACFKFVKEVTHATVAGKAGRDQGGI